MDVLEKLGSRIVYQDADIVVLDKPGGLPSVPARNPIFRQNAYHCLLDTMPPIYVVHRLDTNTSGLIIFARTRNAQIALQKQFAQRQVTKIYHAVVWGAVKASHGEITLPLIADWPRRPLQKACFHTGKPSHTRFQVIAANESHCLLQLTPLSGRTHQLRIHTALIGHPIVGCNLYANPDVHYGRFIKPANISDAPLYLHASQIEFKHPTSGEQLVVQSRENFVDNGIQRFKLSRVKSYHGA